MRSLLSLYYTVNSNAEVYKIRWAGEYMTRIALVIMMSAVYRLDPKTYWYLGEIISCH